MSRICFLLLALFPAGLSAQQLNKTISVKVVRKPVDTVLARISEAGNCSFSYVGKPFRADSLVTLTVSNKTVRQTLDQLFQGRIQYMESGEHIILQRTEAVRERHYVISGYVRDRENGQRIVNASVYDRGDLASAFTDSEGYFQLRLKDRGRQPSVQLTVSKELYLDTNMYVMPGFDRELHVAISPSKPVQLKEFTVSDQVEKTWLGKRLLSQGLRRQTDNISRFFASKPVQSSILPSIGSHGKMAGQVVNKFSLNILGGYSAGTDGVEIAGGFNINKKDAQYVQVAGIFNMVGGNVNGVQVGGIFNHNLRNVEGAQVGGIGNYSEGWMKGVQVGGIYNLMGDSVSGVQIGGIYNGIKGNVRGMQIAGIANMARGSARGGQIAGIANLYRGSVNGIQIGGIVNVNIDTASGMQIAGITNFVVNNAHGVQLSGITNITGGQFTGLQFAALYNHAGSSLNGVQIGLLGNFARKFNRGLQFGLVNVADSSGGLSIGVLNIVRENGYYKLSVYSGDLMPVNVSFKSGRKQFYSIIAGGMNEDLHALGLGIGREFSLRNRYLAITTDLLQQNLFNRSWKSMGQVYRLVPQLHFKASRWFSIQAGPVVSFAEYKDGIVERPGKGYPSISSGRSTGAWLGWQAGISFF
ncbi:hypothetical protein ACFOTA_16005 [Chitinophaga sp. GCM10012297]|uniref:Carboxypeptidase-like protein n=1 Tax=Chitinophaga chungangae TaxID=2821488 RepID=A0ABS3YGB0_9BACT|nr:hypothetical protein [Chitinophaga chungangae]MBO9153723.1 hypothetical protein [Chitinophaga chungangae]